MITTTNKANAVLGQRSAQQFPPRGATQGSGQKYPLRQLIKATGGLPFFIRSTALPHAEAVKWLQQSKSPKAPAILEKLELSAQA